MDDAAADRSPAWKTVLIVDDSRAMQALLTATLEAEFRVVTAADGEDGLTIAREQRPDLILMDVDMPRLDGIQACRRLRSDPELHHIPVFLITGHDDDRRRQQGSDAGAEAYLTKPISPAALLARVHERLAVSVQDGCRRPRR